jgi:hypothetical protein
MGWAGFLADVTERSSKKGWHEVRKSTSSRYADKHYDQKEQDQGRETLDIIMHALRTHEEVEEVQLRARERQRRHQELDDLAARSAQSSSRSHHEGLIWSSREQRYIRR